MGFIWFMENLGFLYAIGAAFCWGTYMVPFKMSKAQNLALYQLLIGAGILISGVIISLLFHFSFNLNLYGLFSGFLWALASSIFLTALLNLGLSKAAPIVSALVIISTFLWGVLVFGEIPSGWVLGFIGILIIIVGVIFVSTTGNTQSVNTKRGLLAAISAGLIWGGQIAPLKIGQIDTHSAFFPVCLGIFLTGAFLSAIKKIKFTKEAVGAAITSGIIWNIGNLVSLLSLSLIGLSKAFPISQGANLVAVLWGLLYFKEIHKTRDKIQVLAGAVILITGVVILGLA